jgi:5'-phosphate synthase pdxT subunit
MHVGVLALQGDFHAHLVQLRALGASCAEVRSRSALERCQALVIPGGESTTLWRLLEVLELEQPLRAWLARGNPVFGTCAGAILLAREILGPDRAGLGALDMAVRRNAYGRQIDSFLARAERAAPGFEDLECLFIRAPVIERVGPGVEVLAEVGGRPVWVRDGRAMAATFHPELTHDLRVHRAFLELARSAAAAEPGAASVT